jgi:hypothetical protein
MVTELEATLPGPVRAELVASSLAFVIDIPVPVVSVALVWGHASVSGQLPFFVNLENFGCGKRPVPYSNIIHSIGPFIKSRRSFCPDCKWICVIKDLGTLI